MCIRDSHRALDARDGLRLDLAHTLPREAQFFSDLLQRHRLALTVRAVLRDAEAAAEDRALLFRKRLEEVARLLHGRTLEELVVGGRDGRLLERIPERAVLLGAEKLGERLGAARHGHEIPGLVRAKAGLRRDFLHRGFPAETAKAPPSRVPGGSGA